MPCSVCHWISETIMAKRKISSYFGSEGGKSIDQEEEETVNEFTHEKQA